MVQNRTVWKVEQEAVPDVDAGKPQVDTRCATCSHAMRLKIGGSQVTYCKILLQPMNNVMDCEGHEAKTT